MKSKTLAAVLIKYFGFTTFLSGLFATIAGIPSVFGAIRHHGSSEPAHFIQLTVTSDIATGAIPLLIGVFLFTKASYIVSTFINVRDELQS